MMLASTHIWMLSTCRPCVIYQLEWIPQVVTWIRLIANLHSWKQSWHPFDVTLNNELRVSWRSLKNLYKRQEKRSLDNQFLPFKWSPSQPVWPYSVWRFHSGIIWFWRSIYNRQVWILQEIQPSPNRHYATWN